MPGDKGEVGKDYLRGVLVDGAKPFRYRGRVRSLLGVPDSEGSHLAFSPAFPPVGFRYTHHAFAGKPYLTTQSPVSEVMHSMLGSAAWEGCVQEAVGENDLVQDGFRERGAVPESSQEQSVVGPTRTPGEPDGGIERTCLEIPGTSEEKQFYPALSPTKRDNAPAGKIGNQPRQEVAPIGPTVGSWDVFQTSQHDTMEKRTVQGEIPDKGTAQRRAVSPSAPLRTGLVERRDTAPRPGPAARATEPGAEIERTDLKTWWGISERSQSFPALSPAKKDDAPAGKTENRSRQKVAPVGSAVGSRDVFQASQHDTTEGRTVQGEIAVKDTARRRAVSPSAPLRTGLVERHDAVPRPGPAARATEPGAEIERTDLKPWGVSERGQSFPTSSPAKKDDAPAEKAENQSRQEVAPVGPAVGSWDVFQVRPHDTTEPSKRMERTGLEILGVTTPPLSPTTVRTRGGGSVRPNAVNRSNAEAAHTIAQLQRAVQRLTARVAPQPARTEQETRRQQPAPAPPAPPVQPLVVVRRSPPRTPRAFWERSYLSRLRLRTLR
ncbi:MAG: hypothetical protein PVF45_06420 [Anaerolineae bacterium]|jgi:hypothetical protein